MAEKEKRGNDSKEKNRFWRISQISQCCHKRKKRQNRQSKIGSGEVHRIIVKITVKENPGKKGITAKQKQVQGNFTDWLKLPKWKK